MSDKISTEVVRRVFIDTEGVCIEVGPDSDVGSYPEIRTVGEKSQEYFGAVRLSMSPEVARQVAKALIACADECEAQP